jgi:hypothetical protein
VIWFSPSQDGDRPILRFRFPNIAGQLTTSSVAVTVIDVDADSALTLTSGTASKSTADGDYWLYDLADVTTIEIDLEAVGEAQLLVVATATLSSTATITRSQQIWINGARANLDDQVTSRAAPGDAMDLQANAVDAAAIATDAIDADALKADAVTEIQAGLATTANLELLDDHERGTIKINQTTDPWTEEHYDVATGLVLEDAFELYDGDGNAINDSNPLTNFIGERRRV